MIPISIQFAYNGTDYKAKAYKMDGANIQYLLSKIDPFIELKSTIFEVNADRTALKFGSEPNNPEISGLIASAIQKSCYEMGIPFLS